MHVFKVPGLRNIAVTGPYLHDGSIPTLESMVQLMVRDQLGKELNDEQVDDIVTFLRALTGELPAEYTAEPELPPDL
jgi:cytochrome c peroxidase